MVSTMSHGFLFDKLILMGQLSAARALCRRHIRRPVAVLHQLYRGHVLARDPAVRPVPVRHLLRQRVAGVPHVPRWHVVARQFAHVHQVPRRPLVRARWTVHGVCPGHVRTRRRFDHL